MVASLKILNDIRQFSFHFLHLQTGQETSFGMRRRNHSGVFIGRTSFRQSRQLLAVLSNYSAREESQRLIILKDFKNLNALRVHSKLWLCDGIFKMCPSQFVSIIKSTSPAWRLYPLCVCILLSNKKESIYNRFHENLISFSGDVINKKDTTHLEQAALNAFSLLFKTETEGCFFH